MEDGSNRKRVRDELYDSEVNSPESKRLRDESCDSDVNSPQSNRFQDDSEDSVVNSPDVKRIQDDLFDILDDSDTVTDRDPAIQGLDSVIKSFEEEILVQPPANFDLTSDSGESQPELGYLLEASDDELGLPPTISSSGEEGKTEDVGLPAIVSDAVGLSEILGFDDEIPSYESYAFGIVGELENHNNTNAEFVTLGGLFDYSDGDFSEFSWRPETLPAL
ncbi:hypothetical protein L1049_027864 [Liquidambar formosana]|uniref:Uncharacterized protein n=1 Tax=Liquidambar formosana TaxID=63359 RepID=A0AAP0RJ28_LIQFO